ncbi:unnamed protein product [Ceratitis capitata]|uniref:(Mediterranean fruit fly) hypothetical protein n=1 Tax=Ceratitis capitata TaxID=7213 RepID=A0A811U3V6_CERCA|nr:unnamed protein product [Ceratitis capitata]
MSTCVFRVEDSYIYMRKEIQTCDHMSLFFLCVTPNILNGFHVSSYTLLGHLPADQWCAVSDLQATNWTEEQQRSITQKNLNTGGCTIWQYDYAKLANMSYEEAFHYASNQPKIETTCRPHGVYAYADADTTFVADWDLVCENALQRTTAQVAISLGKFFGSFSFGIFSDKFGRKASFTLGAAFF